MSIRKVSTTLVGVAALLAGNLLHAGWTATGSVTTVWSHNGYHFIMTTIPVNPCGSGGKFFWLASDPDAKDMFAMALTALAANKPVNVYYDSTNCSSGGQEVSLMSISQ